MIGGIPSNESCFSSSEETVAKEVSPSTSADSNNRGGDGSFTDLTVLSFTAAACFRRQKAQLAAAGAVKSARLTDKNQ